MRRISVKIEMFFRYADNVKVKMDTLHNPAYIGESIAFFSKMATTSMQFIRKKSRIRYP